MTGYDFLNHPPFEIPFEGGLISDVNFDLYCYLYFCFLSYYSSINCCGVFYIGAIFIFSLSFVFVKFKVVGVKAIEGDSVSDFGFPRTSLSLFFESIRLPPRLIGANFKPPTFTFSVFFYD